MLEEIIKDLRELEQIELADNPNLEPSSTEELTKAAKDILRDILKGSN
jgi:hypothetical protein